MEIGMESPVLAVQQTYQKFKIENITVTHAPLLKIYYWQYFDVDGLNMKLQSGEREVRHDFIVPTGQIYSRPLKIVIWLRNWSRDTNELHLKRIKNCECVPVQTRVGFNQFRNLYHCPHRELVHTLQEHIHMEPDELVAMSLNIYFFLFGEHKLTYEISCRDGRKIYLGICLDIIGFDPQKCVLTKELIAVDISEHRRIVQPIWVRNITTQDLSFSFTTRERGLKIVNPKLTVPHQSIWPLMVEYRPSDLYNQLELGLQIDCIRTKVHLAAKGILGAPPPDIDVPLHDYECAGFPYVIYPSKLDFDMELKEERSLMISIHNNFQKCKEFRWQSYIIKNLFEITFEPERFRLKAHHSKLCVVHLRVYERAMHFQRIPSVLEVHRIFDKSTKLAKSLLEEVESIDDPKWKEDSYTEHVFLHINLKVNLKKESRVEVPLDSPSAKGRLQSFAKTQVTTIFEKLFWDYLSKSNFMRESKKGQPISESESSLNYESVLQLANNKPHGPKPLKVNRNDVLRLLSELIFEGVHDLSKSWHFVPREFSEQLL